MFQIVFTIVYANRTIHMGYMYIILGSCIITCNLCIITNLVTILSYKQMRKEPYFDRLKFELILMD